MIAYGAHWAEVLTLRDEVRLTDGSVGELQMSLAKAVYQTVPVPYAKCSYYTDITQPTPLLIGFLGRVARRLGVQGVQAQACFHLDQGMGGGKSHALVGLWHMINSSDAFFASDLGHSVEVEATAGGRTIDLSQVLPIMLIGDSMSPGKTDPRFGPATDLFGRLLWLLFADHSDRIGRWQHYVDLGANKATLQAAFAEVARPLLIVIDELMDYAMALTDQAAIGGLPGEQAFLNAIADAVDDQPQVALIVVMIRSDEDSAGYHPAALDMREYLAARLQRNGETVTVTEPADFAQIIRRRLFARAEVETAARLIAETYVGIGGDDGWGSQVYSKLGSGRTLARLAERIVETYPFHPDLFELVSKEWSVVQAFQRVRSTVAIFARTVLHWVTEDELGRWAPDLIGPGDIPLQTDALEALLSSGVLAGNDRAIQGFRAVANTDVVRSGGGGGTAFNLDVTLAADGVAVGQPMPALRMATACFVYSLVPRTQAARGATKPELIAAIAGPAAPYAAAEEVFNALIAGPVHGGLGALERTRPASGKGAERFYLSIKQTLNMYHANALTMVSNDLALDWMWKRTQQLASKGVFGSQLFLDQPGRKTGAADSFAGVDGQENRLVVLDPRRWTLLNGRDTATRSDLDVAFGVAPGLSTTYAASMVVALVNTQWRTRARDRSKDVLAWEAVVGQLDLADDEYLEACSRRDEARTNLDADVKRAYQHYAYLLRTAQGLAVQYKAIPDGKTALAGQDVWNDLVAASRAVNSGSLAPAYVGQLITTGSFGRDLTPKEIFALPYSNPNWPLIPTIDDLRQALFHLATSSEWMLTDSDGSEIRPGDSGQIQPASLQQLLRARPAPVHTTKSLIEVERAGTAPEIPSDGTGLTPPGSHTLFVPRPRAGDVPGEEPIYEVTKIRMPLSSLTGDAKREAVWGLIRELASLIDPARNRVDIQMIGIDVTVTAQSGDTHQLLAKAESMIGVTVAIEADDL